MFHDWCLDGCSVFVSVIGSVFVCLYDCLPLFGRVLWCLVTVWCLSVFGMVTGWCFMPLVDNSACVCMFGLVGGCIFISVFG